MTPRWIVPEVIQTSAMDCGPASLACLLEGFGIPVSYGRLREACQTDVDGTSIDTMEELGAQLGLACEQVMVPLDHLLLPEADLLPAVVVVKLPNGFTHFVVAWRRHGPFVQIMDPATGRRWLGRERFLAEVYEHTTPIAATTFREWAGSCDFIDALRARLDWLGCKEACESEIDAALSDAGWRPIAALDASVRMTEAIVRGRGVSRGSDAARLVGSLFRGACEKRLTVPDAYWTALSGSPSEATGGAEQVRLRGAVLVRARSRPVLDGAEAAPPCLLSADLAAATTEVPTRAGKRLFDLVRADSSLTIPVVAAGLVGASVATALEATLFRAVIDSGRALGIVQQRLAALGAIAAFALLLALLEWPIASEVLRQGRHLEARLRTAFLAKIPRLGDRYFSSRPTSDMAERCHAIHEVRQIPDLGAQLVRILSDLVVTTAAIAWIDPVSAPWALAAAAAAVIVPLGALPVLVERDLRARTHTGALGRFYLDALLGLAPIRTHGAERSVRREHEALLVEWARAAGSIVSATVKAEGLQAVATYAFTVPLVMGYVGRTSEPAGILLLLYWALNLPSLGQDLALTLRQYPAQRNRTLRLLEPLGAADDGIGAKGATEDAQSDSQVRRGVSIAFEDVRLVASGHTILDQVDLRIAAGEHVAVVGASGAGKSSLVGALLGWHRPSSGRIVVDDAELDDSHIEALRAETAWVDPTVQLWNRSLLENLRYGTDVAKLGGSSFAPILDAADLHDLLQVLPDGLQTALGEGGALVSGGEGQRVRFGRALSRREARLVILDEPFRGLDRERRHVLLARARGWWSGATLLCVTHDISETEQFDRVVVVDGGHVVADGHPDALAQDPGSPYARMLADERELHARTWSSPVWRRLRLDQGRLES